MEIINREISWLQFNERVLQEAAKLSIPIMERLRFLGIYSNNIDEFYRVRIASLNRTIEFNRKKYPAKIKEYEDLYKSIIETITNQQKLFIEIKHEVISELKNYNVFLIDETGLNSQQKNYVSELFNKKILSGLLILKVKKNTDLSKLNDRTIYLAVKLTKSNGKVNYSIIEIPAHTYSRFIVLPPTKENTSNFIIYLDDIVRACLDDIFRVFGYEKCKAYTFKITKDAEIELYGNVTKSYIDIVAESVKKRQIGQTIRFLYDPAMPDDLLNILISCFKIRDKNNIRKGERYHNSKDLIYFPNLVGEKLEYKKLLPIPHRDICSNTTILESILKKDILLHFPYNSFNNIIFLLQEASIDPKVKSISITLYRLAENSKIMTTIINAARNGKYVNVFLEVKARFDEENNINWIKKLEESGVNLIKIIPGIKVHAKLISINYKTREGNLLCSVISTGNFNEDTAKTYNDIALLTANQEIGQEVAGIFYMVDSAYRNINFEQLIVSPLFTRNKILSLFDVEIQNAKKGKNSWVYLKLNNLTDSFIISKIKASAEAGVKINISSRATCCLIGDKSENIITIGIVDRFLEHSRVFAFCNDDKPKYFIGSSDLMIRNLDLRIEVLVPIYDLNLQEEIQTILDIQFSDNQSARDWQTKEDNKLFATDFRPNKRAQQEIYNYIKKLNKKNK